MLKYLLFGFAVYVTVECYVGIISAEEKPPKFAGQEGCYVSKLDRVLQVNVPYSPQDGTVCEKYVCQSNNETYITGCGAKAITESCIGIPGDLHLPYPDCCSKVRCTLPDGSVIEV